MSNKLFVGGLPYSTTEEEMQTLFEQAGAVQSVAIIKDKFTNRSKGFGFVEMASDEEAQKAVSMLDGTDVGGRSIKVDIARPPRDRE